MVAKLVRERGIAPLKKTQVGLEVQKIRLLDPSPSPVASPTPPLLVQPLDCPPSPLIHNSGAQYEVWYHSQLAAAAKLAATPVQAKTTNRVARFQLRSEPRTFENRPPVVSSSPVVDTSPPRFVFFSTV